MLKLFLSIFFFGCFVHEVRVVRESWIDREIFWFTIFCIAIPPTLIMVIMAWWV